MNTFLSSALRRVRRVAKRMKICTRCLSNPAEKGKTKCQPCNKEISETQPPYLRKKYREADKAGLCVRCRENPQQETNKRCAPCQEYHAEHKRKKK